MYKFGRFHPIKFTQVIVCLYKQKFKLKRYFCHYYRLIFRKLNWVPVKSRKHNLRIKKSGTAHIDNSYFLFINFSPVYILYAFAFHLIYILYTFAFHLIYILYTFAFHLIYILYTFAFHLVCNASGFYMRCKTGLKWV